MSTTAAQSQSDAGMVEETLDARPRGARPAAGLKPGDMRGDHDSADAGAVFAQTQPATLPLSLYVHLPWCLRKCPYCDFNSHAARGPLPFADYVDALVRDLEFDLPLVAGRRLASVFFGGGTPSLFPPEQIARLLEAADVRLPFESDCEVTLEANPGAAECGAFEGYARAGVNRISFGVQSFDDGCLKRLGRIHDAGQATRAIRQAQDAGFDNLNLDLMYALPGQGLAMAQGDIAQAIALAPAHISHYQLTLEPNTVFAARPPPGIADDDIAWEMQESGQQQLTAGGYGQYEVSAHARPGRQCAHNLNYWRFGDYLGIGAGAHGKLSFADADGLQLRRRWKHKHPARYLQTAGTQDALGGDDRIEASQRPFEFMLNALRLREGFRAADFEHRTGLAFAQIAMPVGQALARGWLRIENGRYRPSEHGRRFNNDLVGLFL